MNSRDRFLKTAQLEKADRPPVWLIDNSDFLTL